MNTPAPDNSFLADEPRWAAQAAGRLRLIQTTCADETPEGRQNYLETEMRRLLDEVPPGKRKSYLAALADRFPTWQKVSAAPAGVTAAARLPETVDELVEAVIAAKLSPAERQKLRDRLAESGIIEPAAASADGFASVRKHVMLAPADPLVPARLEKLVVQQLEFFVKLDQLAWNVWKTLGPKSNLKRDPALSDTRAFLRRYLKGDAEVADGQVAQQIERTRQLTAILLGSLSQVGRGYAKRHQKQFAPEAIRELVRMEGGFTLTGVEKKCWLKYAELAAEISEHSIQDEMQEVVAKYVEDLMRGAPKNPA